MRFHYLRLCYPLMSCAHQKQDFCAILTNIHLRNYLYAPTKFPQICKYSPITGRFCAKIVAQVCPYGIIRTNRKTLVLQVNTPKATQCETGVASTAKWESAREIILLQILILYRIAQSGSVHKSESADRQRRNAVFAECSAKLHKL